MLPIDSNSVLNLKSEKRTLIKKYVHKNNLKGALQVINTLLPTGALFYLAIEFFYSYWYLSVVCCLFAVLFVLRIFVLMHDCGHNALFSKPKANSWVGFILGVFCGVPQYVWSKHHDYHHATNGNWEKYRGPLAVLSVEEYQNLDAKKRAQYAKNRRIRLGPIAGFLYFIFNPRFNWLKGCVQLFLHVAKTVFSSNNQPKESLLSGFKTSSWADWTEFWHMTANNLCLLVVIALSLSVFDPLAFAVVYLVVLSLAGGAGIILFTVQHNYEDTYASSCEGWCYDTAAIAGTSFLRLPRILDWFTADIAYHHVHHLSARIPNYHLRECHKEYEHLFSQVKQIRLKDIPHCFKYIIWDESQNTLITVDDFNLKYS